MKKIQKFIPYLVFALAISFFASSFFVQRNFMTDLDERDHLAAGYLMKEGRKLYKDIFSHHFPFPYYWTFLFTPLWGNTASRTVGVFRLSLLVFYLISFFTTFFCLKNKRSKYAFSFWILIFSLFLTLYHGQLLLSETFSVISIVCVFWLVLPVLLDWEEFDLKKIFSSIFFASIGFWTQPLLFPLFLIPIILSPKTHRLKTIFILLIINALPLLYFSFSGQLKAFLEQAIWFNFAIYFKYYNLGKDHYSNIPLLENLLHFWYNEINLLTQLFSPIQFSQFFLHLSYILLTVIVIKKRKMKHFLVFLLLFLASRIREIKIVTGLIFNFGIFPFMAIASAAFAQLAVHFYPKKKAVVIVSTAALITAFLFSSWPIIKQSLKPGYNYHVFWSYRQNDGEIIRNLSLPEEKVLIYPHDVDLYFFAQRQPIDRFLYWYRWTNSVPKYRQERLTALEENSPAIIYIGNLRVIEEDLDYYSRIFPDLLDNYRQVYKEGKETNIWLRADLLNRINPPYQTAPSLK
jgi:hypothetical protein